MNEHQKQFTRKHKNKQIRKALDFSAHRLFTTATISGNTPIWHNTRIPRVVKCVITPNSSKSSKKAVRIGVFHQFDASRLLWIEQSVTQVGPQQENTYCCIYLLLYVLKRTCVRRSEMTMNFFSTFFGKM